MPDTDDTSIQPRGQIEPVGQAAAIFSMTPENEGINFSAATIINHDGTRDEHYK